MINNENRIKFLDELSALLQKYEVDEMSAEYIADSDDVPYDAKIVFHSNGKELSFMRHVNGQFEQLETYDPVYRPKDDDLCEMEKEND